MLSICREHVGRLSLKDSSQFTGSSRSQQRAAGVKSWKVAISSDYSRLYFMYQGTVQTEWDYSYMGNNPVGITYADGTTGMAEKIQFTGNKVDKDETEAVYNGIVIDGEFKDWDAVKKYDASCPNEAHNRPAS